MDDDFSTPRAISAIIAYSKEVESYASRPIGRGSVELILKTFDYFGNVFGILELGNARQSKAFEEVLKVLLRLREDARKRGDWSTADRIRESLTKIGIGLEDTSSGARWYLVSGAS